MVMMTALFYVCAAREWHCIVMVVMTGLFYVCAAREWRCDCDGGDDWFVLGLCGT